MKNNELFPEYLTSQWVDYELIDTGNFEKLERFGPYYIARPEPQALWNKSLPAVQWEKLTHAKFIRPRIDLNDISESGIWKLKPDMPDRWIVRYQYGDTTFSFRLALTSFKHVGLFPEQASNWDFIIDSIKKISIAKPKLLNLFAYTGGASLAACAAGAEVTHVDSVKQVISWARDNMEISGFQNIRWVVEDALLFARRESKRGNKYHGIILDPPAYGRGPKGEKWLLDSHIGELLKYCSQILEKQNSFLILNMYSMGYSPFIAENLVRNYFRQAADISTFELYMTDKAGYKLPLGICSRFFNPG